LANVGGVKQVSEHVGGAHLELSSLRVLVLIDHILVICFRIELLGLWLHPCVKRWVMLTRRVTGSRGKGAEGALRPI
jgi:hypothetical protein